MTLQNIRPQSVIDLCDRAIGTLSEVADGPKISALQFAQAQAYRSLQNYPFMKAVLEASVKSDPNNVRAALMRAGWLYSESGDIGTIQGIWERNPNDARVLSAWVRVANFDNVKKLEMAKKAVRLAGSDPESLTMAHQCLAQYQYKTGHYKEAVASCDIALIHHSAGMWYENNWKLYVFRGLLNLELGETEHGLADLATARRFGPAPHPILARGVWVSQIHAGKFHTALALTDAHAVEYAKDPFVHVMRAATLNRLGRHKEAVAELDAYEPDAYADLERAAAHHLGGDETAAGKVLDGVLKKYPAFKSAVLAVAALRPADHCVVSKARGDLRSYSGCGDLPDRVAAAIDADPKSPPAAVAVMMVHAAAKDYAKAADLAEAALANRRFAPCYREPLLAARAAYQAGKPYVVPPALLRAVYQPPVMFE